MSGALLPGIAAQRRPDDRASNGVSARARIEHFAQMNATVAQVDCGLRVFFRTSSETWFWRDAGGGWFEEAERISPRPLDALDAPADAPPTNR